MTTVNTTLVLDVDIEAEIHDDLTEIEREVVDYLIRTKVALGLMGQNAPTSEIDEHASRIEDKYGIPPSRTREIYSNIRDASWDMSGRELAPPA